MPPPQFVASYLERHHLADRMRGAETWPQTLAYLRCDELSTPAGKGLLIGS